MSKVTEHFNLDEFKCNCLKCSFTNIDYILVVVLELVREHFKQPIYITSGNRCFEYNYKIGGYKQSKHIPSVDMNGQTYATAVDFYVKDVDVWKVYAYLDKMFPSFFGIGVAEKSKFIHLDSRLDKAHRWEY